MDLVRAGQSRHLSETYLYCNVTMVWLADEVNQARKRCERIARIAGALSKNPDIVLPPVRDCETRFDEIVIADAFSSCDSLEQKNATLRRTRDLLLPRLISGELDVSELDIAVPEEARSMTPAGYTEDALIEQPAIALLKALGWETVNAYHEFDHGASTLGRETRAEVILNARLRQALLRLNPDAPIEAIHMAIEELTRDRSRMSAAAANREIYHLLKNGVRVPVSDPEGDGETVEVVRVVDWDDPANNDFLLCSQFWVTGEMYTRRADLVGFVNGLPLLFIELKAAHRRLETAFTGNLRDYKDTIPQLFWHNALIILSNGSQSRVGSVTAGWEHFADWKQIGSEDEAGPGLAGDHAAGRLRAGAAAGPGRELHACFRKSPAG